MRLTVLDPEFLVAISTVSWRYVKIGEDGIDISKVDGLFLVCPQCYINNGNKRPGCHGIICWRPRISQEYSPQGGRWEFEGTGLEDLTLVAGSSSILLPGPGCGAHFFIRNGEVIMT